MTDDLPPPAPYRAMRVAPSACRMRGDDLVIPRGASLPKVCLKCGARKKLATRDELFIRAPAALPLLLLLSPLTYAVGVVLFCSRARATVSLCPPCDAAWRDARTARNLLSMVGIVMTVAIAVAVFNDMVPLGVVLTLVSAGATVWTLRRFVLARTLDVVAIDARELALRGVHSAAAQICIETAGE
jgi:hypothetical protein